MSKYTAEQVRNVARLLDGESRSMLNEYAAQLREREAAKMVVTDEMVENAWSAFFDARQRGEYDRVSMRAALEAVSLMLASARPIDAETVLDEYVRICAAEHAEHAAAADRVDAMRRALAHAGAASARVPDVVTPVHAASGLNTSERHAWALGWNDCRDAMLAVAPKHGEG